MSETSDIMTAEQFREAIVDYLYDEMDAATRASFERTMRESDALTREVDDLARALRISRRALQAAATEAPPARVRRNVLAAAAAASTRANTSGDRLWVAQPGADVVPGGRGGQRDGGRGRESGEGGEGGIWGALMDFLRRPWAIPAMGAAAALALFFIARKEITHNEHLDAWRKQNSELAAPEPTTVESPTVESAAPESAAPESAAQMNDEEANQERLVHKPPQAKLAWDGKDRNQPADKPEGPREPENEAEVAAADEVAPQAKEQGRYAPPPPGWSKGGVGAGAELQRAPGRFDGQALTKAPEAEVPETPEAKQEADAPSPFPEGRLAEAPAPASPARSSNRQRARSADLSGGKMARKEASLDSLAGPASGAGEVVQGLASGAGNVGLRDQAVAPTQEPAPALEQRAPSESGPLGGVMAEPTLQKRPMVTNKAKTQPPAKIMAKKVAPAPASPASASVAALDDDALGEKAASKNDDKKARTHADERGDLLAEAQRLMKQGRYFDAAAVYRKLLQRFPADPAVKSWRAELAVANRAASNKAAAQQ